MDAKQATIPTVARLDSFARTVKEGHLVSGSRRRACEMPGEPKASGTARRQIKAFREAAHAYSERATRSPQAAREELRKLGITTKSGRLTSKYK
jgi:hypothetical protein